MEVSNVSKEVIFILVIVSMAIWITVSKEAVKPSKEVNWQMITLLSAGSFIRICYNHYAFSKPAVIVPLTGALIQQKGLTHFLFSHYTIGSLVLEDFKT